MFIRELMEEDVQEEDELLAVQQDIDKLSDINFKTDPMGYQYFAERINEISEVFIEMLFDMILAEVEKPNQYLLRGVGNDLWNFVYFIFTCLEKLDIQKPVYDNILKCLELYCVRMLEKEKDKFTNFFRDLFLSKYVDAVKSAESYDKREALIRLLYCFVPNTSSARHEALRLYKAKVDDMLIFIQSLAILVDMERELTKENDDLIKDFKIYAKLAIKDKRPTVRLNGLLLMNKLIYLDNDWVQRVMLRYFDCVSANDQWENRIMIVSVYSNILSKLKEDKLYQEHIKPRNNEMAKVVSVESEMLIRVMKETIEAIGQVLSKVLSKNLSPVLTRVSMIYIAEVMEDNRNLANVFLDLLLNADDEIRDWVLNTPNEDEVNMVREKFYFKTRTSLCYPCILNRDNLKNAANDLLTEMSTKLRNLLLPGTTDLNSPDGHVVFNRNYLDVIVFCFENADFQRLNAEVTDTFINNSIEHVMIGLKYPNLADGCSLLLLHYMDSFLRDEVILTEFEKRLAHLIVSTLNGEDVPEQYHEQARENLKAFIAEMFARNTADKAVYEKFIKTVTKIHSLANRKTIQNPDDAEFIEHHFGTSDEGSGEHDAN